MDTSNQFYFQWHFLSKCNLRCKHCYQEEYAHGEMNFYKLIQVADQMILALERWNMYGRISLTGGEPFVSDSLFPLLEYLDKNDRIISIDILTNGTLITEADISRLRKIKKLHQIQISLDGGTSDVHDAVRGRGAFDRAINAIRMLRNAGIEVALMFTLMKLNQNNYMEFIDVAEAENVNAITIERVTPCGNSNIEDILTSEEVKRIYTAITLRANEMNQSPVIRRARPLWVNTLCDNTRTDVNIGGFCPVGLTALAILWDGTVLPCRRLEIPLGNILKDGLFKIWYDSEVLWNIRNKSNLKGKCNGCNNLAYCGGCRAVAYAITGDYMEEDPQCWMKK